MESRVMERNISSSIMNDFKEKQYLLLNVYYMSGVTYLTVYLL